MKLLNRMKYKVQKSQHGTMNHEAAFLNSARHVAALFFFFINFNLNAEDFFLNV